jgi:hypothetical protein
VIAYRATLDVPRELVHHLARLLAAERRARGTRQGTRALTCFRQALMVLVWFRKGEDKALLARFAVGATARSGRRRGRSRDVQRSYGDLLLSDPFGRWMRFTARAVVGQVYR